MEGIDELMKSSHFNKAKPNCEILTLNMLLQTSHPLIVSPQAHADTKSPLIPQSRHKVASEDVLNRIEAARSAM